MFKKAIQQVIDWNSVDKAEYLLAMQRSVIKDIELKAQLKPALTDKINDPAFFSAPIHWAINHPYCLYSIN